MSKAAERAVELFKTGRNCAQSVYAASGAGGAMSEEQHLAAEWAARAEPAAR
jgi:hypothetical protein